MKIKIIVHPNSRHSKIEKDLLGTYHVYLNAPPLEGKANIALIKALADYFRLRKSDIQITSGFKSKLKTISLPDSINHLI